MPWPLNLDGAKSVKNWECRKHSQSTHLVWSLLIDFWGYPNLFHALCNKREEHSPILGTGSPKYRRQFFLCFSYLIVFVKKHGVNPEIACVYSTSTDIKLEFPMVLHFSKRRLAKTLQALYRDKVDQHQVAGCLWSVFHPQQMQRLLGYWWNTHKFGLKTELGRSPCHYLTVGIA